MNIDSIRRSYISNYKNKTRIDTKAIQIFNYPLENETKVIIFYDSKKEETS